VARRSNSQSRRHWILVAACAGLVFMPAGLRAKARGALLDLHVRLAPQPATGVAVAPDDAARVRLLEAEVRRLRRALAAAGAASELLADPRVRLIPADVIPLEGKSGILSRVALARGRDDGVEPGQVVLADSVLVGRVATVTASTCEVLLATDPTFRIRATVSRDDQDVEGLLAGDGTATLSFEPVVADDVAAGPVLRAGETVVSSRASVLCGVSALIGTVEEIERYAGDTSPRARVRPACDLGAVGRVVIVRGGGGA
jgi:cell shape-determining protein MreC